MFTCHTWLPLVHAWIVVSVVIGTSCFPCCGCCCFILVVQTKSNKQNKKHLFCIIQSIRLAHVDLKPGKILINHGRLDNANANRSPPAYDNNPANERNK